MRLVYTLVFTFFFFLGAFRFCLAQEVVAPISLPTTATIEVVQVTQQRTLDSLCNCVRSRYLLQLDAELAALEVGQKGQWIKYLPQVGVTYDIQGRPRPAASISTATLYTAKRDQQQRVAQRESIRRHLQLEEAQVIGNLTRKYQRLVAEGDRADRLAGIAEIDRELFYLYERQHAANEITPEEFLLKKKAFLVQEMRGFEHEEKLRQLRYEVEDLAQCPVMTDNSNFSLDLARN